MIMEDEEMMEAHSFSQVQLVVVVVEEVYSSS